MLDEEETIYNLVPKPPPVIERPPKYVSPYANTTSSTIKVVQRKGHATMGETPEKLKAGLSHWMKAHEREPKIPKMPNKAPPRERSPPIKDNPNPARKRQQPVQRRKHKEWQPTKDKLGKHPAYLDRVQKESIEETAYWDDLRERMLPEDTETRCRVLPEDERLAILEGLRENLADNKRRYAALSFGQDNLSFRRKKEELEREAAQLEADIKVFERQHVYVTEN